jgi:hypothetical protein
MRKIDIKKLKNIRISKEGLSKILHAFLSYRRLLFIIFWGAILIYSFDILYKKVYIDIQFIDYGYVSSPRVNKEMNVLNRISEDIETRFAKRQNIKNNTYRDPFKYSGDAVSGSGLQSEAVNNDSNSNNMQNMTPGQW